MCRVRGMCVWGAVVWACSLFTPVAAWAQGDAPAKPDAAAKPAEVQYAELTLRGAYPEGAQSGGGLLGGGGGDTLTDLLDKLDRVARDGKIAGLILKLDNPSVGWARMRAIRQAIGQVRKAGKPVHAYFDEADNMDYLLATGCDEIWMPSSGGLNTVGLRAEVTFYKKAFDLVGIQAEMLRVGEFKSAGEPYSRTEMSPEFRREMEEIIDDLFGQLVATIAEARKLTPEQVRQAIDEAPLLAAAALEKKLVDHIGYTDELEGVIATRHPGQTLKVLRNYGQKKKVEADLSTLPGLLKFMELLAGEKPDKKKSTQPKLAIIHAQGMIVSGKSGVDFTSGETSLGSETFIKAVREAREDDTVKAIVLRIDSPGGSALASDLMWHELEQVKKPFVVSMGDTAASGGYYIAMGADRIFADPGTITGSIGVIGMKIPLAGAMQRIGVTTDVIARGKNSGVLSTFNGYTDSERETMQKLLNEIYRQFTTKAAQGRKMPVEALEKLARGRVYTGGAALKLGLVDELGGLAEAIAHAKQLAGLKPEDKLERLDLPKAGNPLESLLGGAGGGDARAQLVREQLLEWLPEAAAPLKQLGMLRKVARDRGVFLVPFDLRIE